MAQAPTKREEQGAEPAPGQSALSARLALSVSKLYELDAPSTQKAVATGLLMRVRELLMRDIDKALAEFCMSHARYQVLAIICRAPAGLQLGEIATRAFVHPTTMTSTIDRLIRHGLIERRADPKDRRGILAVATPKGVELYEKARDTLAVIEFGLSGMDTETVDALIIHLDKVAVMLEHKAGLSG